MAGLVFLSIFVYSKCPDAISVRVLLCSAIPLFRHSPLKNGFTQELMKNENHEFPGSIGLRG